MQVSQQTSKRTADSASTLDVSEQRLRSLVDYSAVAIAFTDLRGRLSHVNSSFADLLGYQADELLGRSFKDFLHPADRSRIMHLFLRIILLRRQPRMMEFRALHKEGHTLYLMSKPTRTIQSGKTFGFQAIITDITDRKKMEEELRRYSESLEESHKRLSAILDFVKAGIVIIDVETHKIVDANPAAVKMIDLPREQIVGQLCHKFICPAEQGKCPITDLSQHVDNSERVLLNASGHRIPILKTVTSQVLGGNRQLIESFLDITERKRLEEELKRYSGRLEVLVKEKTRDLVDSEERYRRLIEVSPQAIHVHCEGKFVYANNSAVGLYGAERPEQLVGKPVVDFVHPDYREIVKERIRLAIEGNVASPYLEMKFLRLDGTEIDVAVVAIPTTYQGKPAVQVVTLDIADRKRMEKAKDNFISAVTHELRTPLTSLKGYLELVMNESEPLSSQIKSDLEVVKRNTNRLLSLTNDLLDIQRMNSGKLQLNLEQLDLQEVIAEATKEISPLVQARKQILNIEAPQHPLLINGDRIRLSQVLMNLLSNATKFAPEGGKIRLNARDDDALVTIAVSDPGIGIKEEDLEKVFEPFAAISKPTYIKGTGLGLSIVKGLVEAHGGKTWVESPGEGRGATFTCTLPKRRQSTEQITKQIR